MRGRATSGAPLASWPVVRVLALLPALSLAALLGTGPVPAPSGPQIGQPAPDFALRTLDGRLVRLADYRGKTLVVNVWGSWCPPCRLETPDLIAESLSEASQGVAFLGVDTTESAAAAKAFVAAKGVPYPQAVTDTYGAFARAYDIRNYPTTLVIGPDGVLRARHADNILPRAQLHAYIVAAQAGESAPLESAFQTQLDALLDPAHYSFEGDAQTIRMNVHQALAAIARADDLMDDAMDDPSRDHDLVATQAEEERLRTAAAAAFATVAVGDADAAFLARLRGDSAVARGDWKAAEAEYAQALVHNPNDVDALSGEAVVAANGGDQTRVVGLMTRIAALAPSPSSFVGLGEAEAKRGHISAAETAFAQARTRAKTPRAQAWTNLHEGRVEAAAGRRPQAREAFARALAAATRIPSNDAHETWYVEQAQEGMIALGVLPGAAPSVSLAPWTGPDLPGSSNSTIKYRLAVTGAPGSALRLSASGLPAHWIASFCTDRVCAPFRTTVVMPADGVKIVEFQVIPTGRAGHPVRVRVDAALGARPVASAGTTVTG